MGEFLGKRLKWIKPFSKALKVCQFPFTVDKIDLTTPPQQKRQKNAPTHPPQ